jgi:lipase maturation factor 1
VTALLKKNPFTDKPPVYLRAQFYDYTYSDSEEKAKGVWWERRLVGPYLPVARLNTQLMPQSE